MIVVNLQYVIEVFLDSFYNCIDCNDLRIFICFSSNMCFIPEIVSFYFLIYLEDLFWCFSGHIDSTVNVISCF